MKLTISVCAMVLMAWGTSAAGATDAQKCEAAKLKISGKYNFCRLKAEAKAVKTGNPVDYSKCDTNFSEKWGTAESTAGGMCPSTGDASSLQTRITGDANDIIACLNGTCPPSCGDGAANGAESCDGSDLGGESCTSLGYASGTLACTAGCGFDLTGCVANPQGLAFPASGQKTCWNSSGAVVACAGTGHDGDVQAGAILSYVDNGDGTITDLNTGLMWEKNSFDGSIHNAGTGYTWNTATATRVATLNSSTFAGYNDWRLPNVKELQSIIDYEKTSGPAVNPAFNNGCALNCTVSTCSCTIAGGYWSSTSDERAPTDAWIVQFASGAVTNLGKSNGFSVRAVRGGVVGGGDVCGDGNLNPGEACDPPGSNTQCPSAVPCSASCTCPANPCPGGGVPLAGACWYLGGGVGVSCDATCAGVGMACAPATVTYAGTGGTSANCQSLMAVLAPGVSYVGAAFM